MKATKKHTKVARRVVLRDDPNGHVFTVKAERGGHVTVADAGGKLHSYEAALLEDAPATEEPESAEVELIRDLWWFIENVTDETPDRTERFFALRERVRDISRPNADLFAGRWPGASTGIARRQPK